MGQAKPRVVIYGGGITGLSAAHELTERGFEVHIVEKNQRPYRDNDCDIGGIARTQWTYREAFDGDFNVATSVMSDQKGLGHIWPTNRKIRFHPGTWIPDEGPELPVDPQTACRSCGTPAELGQSNTMLDVWLRELAADLLELITDTSSQWFTRKSDEQRTRSADSDGQTTWYSYLTVEGFASRWEKLHDPRLDDWRRALREAHKDLDTPPREATRAALAIVKQDMQADFRGLPQKMYDSMWLQNNRMLEHIFLELLDRRYIVPPMSERWVYGLSLMRSYVLLGRLYEKIQTYQDTDAEDGVCREVANLLPDDVALLRRLTLPLCTIFTNNDDRNKGALIGRLFSDRSGQPCLTPSAGDRKAVVVMQPYTLLDDRIFDKASSPRADEGVREALALRLQRLEAVADAHDNPDTQARLKQRLSEMKNDVDQLAREVVAFREGPAYTAIMNSNHDGVRARLELIPMALGESEDPDRQPVRRPLPPLSLPEEIEKSMRQELEPDHRMAYAGLNFIENLMPGEHGYRYFPAFYHNLFDTMRRTPILERRDMTPLEQARLREWQHTVHQIQRAKQKAHTSAIKPSDVDPLLPPAYIETGRTVFDNLLPNSSHAIADQDDERPYEMPRSELRSTAELLRLLRYMMEKRGFTREDMTSFSLKMLQYLTSCADRRETYEAMTWWEFLDADARSEAYGVTLEEWPQALVGLRSKEGDARSIGSVSVQLMADQLMPSGYRDGTLNGPTSVAWLEPWRRYLEARGVRFHHGWLHAIERRGDAHVDIKHYLHSSDHTGRRYTDHDADKRDQLSQESIGQLAPHPAEPHFSLGTLTDEAMVVVATPLFDTWKILHPDEDGEGRRRRGAFDGEDSDLGRLADFLPLDTEARLQQAQPDSPLQHYAGMQFYIDFELGPEKGHVYYAGTPWRLSSISQAQFWTHRNESEYLGVLSVVIGNWSIASEGRPEDPQPAWTLPPSEIAREVWHQLSARLEHSGRHIPKPRAYHIDDEIRFGLGDSGHIRPLVNRTPYQINRVGDWERRPGRLDDDEGYEVMYGRLVLAGPHMKTHTRLVTMEAANESARHAVNGLLHHYLAQREAIERDTGEPPPRFVTVHRCPIFNIEDHEPGDLMLLKELDEKLMAQGLPHFLEILEADKLVENPATPLLRALGSLHGPTRAAIAALLDVIRG